MKNMFNKANTPYLVSSTLAIATLLASGVFAAAPYAGFLAPVAVLGVGLPFIIGGAVLSALVATLSIVAISKNNTISQQEKFESHVTQRKQEEKNAIEELNIPDTIPLPYKSILPHAIALPDEDSQSWVAVAKEKVRNWIPSSKTVESIAGTAVIAGVLYAAGKSSPDLVANPIGNIGSNNLTSNLTSRHLSFPDHTSVFSQAAQQNEINGYHSKLKYAQEFAEGDFGISQNSSEPQWFKDLNKSETTEEIIDGGILPNPFHEGSNSDYQFAKPNITHAESSKTVGSNQTAIAKYSGANTGFTNFMGTYGRFLKNLNPFGSREHSIDNVPSLFEEVDSTRPLAQPVLVTAY